MPTTNDTRSVKILGKPPGVTASDFTVGFAATFTTGLGVLLNFSDKSTDTCDRTCHEVVISDPATGAELGRTWIKVKVETKLLNGFEAKLDLSGRGELDPPASGKAKSIREPSTSDVRRWAQAISQSSGNVLRNVAVVTVESFSESGSVSQTVGTNDPSSLAIAVEFSDAAGGTVGTGTVTLSTAAIAGDGFELGPVKITDTEDDGEAVRTVHR